MPKKALAERVGRARLPDAGAVFDRLFARPQGQFKPCPCGANALIISSLAAISRSPSHDDVPPLPPGTPR